MSEENVELVKVLIPQDTDIVPLFRDDAAWAQVRELVSPFCTDDFESVAVFLGQTRTYPGLDGLRKNWLDWLEPWATYRLVFEELIDAGEHVVSLDRTYGRRKDMEEEVELIAASVLTFRDGKVARWADYTDRADALKAVGLQEQLGGTERRS